MFITRRSTANQKLTVVELHNTNRSGGYHLQSECGIPPLQIVYAPRGAGLDAALSLAASQIGTMPTVPFGHVADRLRDMMFEMHLHIAQVLWDESAPTSTFMHPLDDLGVMRFAEGPVIFEFVLDKSITRMQRDSVEDVVADIKRRRRLSNMEDTWIPMTNLTVEWPLPDILEVRFNLDKFWLSQLREEFPDGYRDIPFSA